MAVGAEERKVNVNSCEKGQRGCRLPLALSHASLILRKGRSLEVLAAYTKTTS